MKQAVAHLDEVVEAAQRRDVRLAALHLVYAELVQEQQLLVRRAARQLPSGGRYRCQEDKGAHETRHALDDHSREDGANGVAM